MTGRPARFDPIDFLEHAVATPSHEGVDAMRDLLVEALADHGVSASVDAAGNVLAERGDGPRHVVLNTHLDTVSPHVPFERDGDHIRGRGACDAKGPLAAYLAAFLAADGPRVTLAVTPDEEEQSTGAAALDLDADAFLVGEPTGLDVCNAARGRFVAIVQLSGVSAHAAEAGAGVNAVAAAREALDALATYDVDHGPPIHTALGDPRLTPTVIRGGEATNQVPAACTVTVDRRSVPPETADGFRASLEAHVREAVTTEVGVAVELAERPTPYLGPFETPADDPLVSILAVASGGAVRPFAAATEASYFAARGPTVVFGPGVLVDDAGPVAHADREYVRVEEVRAARDAVLELFNEIDN